ncbi:MAG: hypothetical protein LBP81_02590 [Treponema sp.]|jgi:hypothetical protein|nr:hypothetical protein [Treponema sp.]
MGGRGYETLEAAINAAAGTTATITLMRDIGVSSRIPVSASDITLTGGETNYVITNANNTVNFTFFDLAEGSNFTLDKGVTLQGGRVQVKSGAALFLKDGAKITGNTIFGRSVMVYEGGTFTMEGGSIEGNTSTTIAGGVYNNGTFIMRGGSINVNTAYNDDSGSGSGGGVYVNSTGTFTMKGGEINSNTAGTGGGGVYVSSTGTFTMEGGSIGDNSIYSMGYTGSTIDYKGGGVYNGGTFTMKDGSSISLNQVDAVCHTKTSWESSYGSGGGVYNDGTFTMEGGSIEENSVYADHANSESASYAWGGGVYNAGTFTMQDGSISRNEASADLAFLNDSYAYGGGVYLDSDSVITKTGGTINGNTVYSKNNAGAEEVYVNCTGNPVNPVRLENPVEADHNLTKATDDDTADELTFNKGWTE